MFEYMYIHIFVFVGLPAAFLAASGKEGLRLQVGSMYRCGTRIQRGMLPPGLSCWHSEKVGNAPDLIEL